MDAMPCLVALLAPFGLLLILCRLALIREVDHRLDQAGGHVAGGQRAHISEIAHLRAAGQ